MKLSDWAKKQGILYQTAWNMFKAGKLPNAYKLPTGTIIVPDEKPCKQEHTVTYARVSSSENKDNLKSQSERLYQFCVANGWVVEQHIAEIGSGLNDHRPKLEKLLRDESVTRIVIEHKDRLTRFGFNYIKTLLERNGVEIVVINSPEDDKDDLIQDFFSVITSFCARIYGQRRSKRNTEKLIEQLSKEE
jgi:predicted site-specific integrase-resolvase